ncbi:hypothetical protein Tco_1062922 [Tanacetum coccineum]
MDKRKRVKLTLEIFGDIFKICPRVQGQDFDALPIDEEIMSFLRELGHTGEINSLNDVISTNPLEYVLSEEYGLSTPPKIARKFKKASPSKKDLNLNLVLVDEEPKSAKKKVPAKKTTRKQTLGVVIGDTPMESSSKRNEKVDVARGKGIELLSEVALTEDAQFEEFQKKSLRYFHRTHPSGFGAGNDEDDSNNDNNSKSDESDEENDSDDENTQSNNENEFDFEHKTNENETGSKSDHQENEEEVEDNAEEKEDEYVRTPSYYSPTDDEDET